MLLSDDITSSTSNEVIIRWHRPRRDEDIYFDKKKCKINLFWGRNK